MAPPRIVITGLGGICGLGSSADEIWAGMREGRNGIAPYRNPALQDLRVTFGGQIDEIPDIGIEPKDMSTMDPFSFYTVISAHQAMVQAGLEVDEARSHRAGAIIGTGIAGCDAIQAGYEALYVEGKKRVNVFSVPRIMPGAPAGQVSMRFGLRGPVFGVSSACSSSNHAILSGLDQMRAGRADVMLVGGTEAPLTFGSLKAWEALRVLSRDACRPFSANRSGLVLGEGAAVAVLETEEHAKARGANILAELAGAGLCADAGDIVAPAEDGMASAISLCLSDAGLNPKDVDYINAHGTATKANDASETAAIKSVFGNHATNLSLSSTKSMHSHCLGASGALEVIACVNTIREGVVPPTINYEEPDPDCDLDVTPNEARERPIKAAISNAFAFGGTNAVVAFRAYQG